MPLSEQQKEKARAYMAERRRLAKEKGETLPGDNWAALNPEKHRKRVARWRSENTKRAGEIYRANQAVRRSTPWGQITNRIWPCLHRGVFAKRPRSGKYTTALGYSWADLRVHLESQFSPEMTWGNWGEVWELDHIRPLSTFRYTSLSDPLFRECWALSNLRPLLREHNQEKGATEGRGH